MILPSALRAGVFCYGSASDRLPRVMVGRACACALVASVVVVVVVDGATYTWSGGSGAFGDATQWDSGVVPGSGDTAVVASGTIYMDGDFAVNNLKMSGGEMVLGVSECPDGWSTTLTFDGCVKAYAEPKTWLAARMASSPSSMTRLPL